MASFTDFDLPKSLQKAIDELGLTAPTPIQVKSMPVILSGRDIIGIAQTGTGKTYAYLLPVLKQWKFSKTDSPRIIIIVPTRELVVQVAGEVEKLTQYMSVRVLGVYGGTNINTQKKALSDGVDILVGTPGRIMDLGLDGDLRFDALQKLIIDEFDEILNLGFRAQITSILAMLKNKRQNILFSATMTDEVDEMLDEYFDFPEEVSLAPSGTPLEKIKQYGYRVPNFLTKINLLKDLLHRNNGFDRILVFVNNKKTADLVFEALEENFPGMFDVIHSNKSQNYRLNTLASFQNGKLRGIVTTDVMARGLDISDITHVINMEFPEIPEQYIHRIGRTGRKDKEGTSISFVSSREEEMQINAEILMEKEIEFLDLPDIEKVDKLLEFEKEKKKIKFLLKKPKLEGGGAFHEKKDKNKKVNLGGPGRRNPKKTKPANRGAMKGKNKKK
ncbi:MAG: DEAD/DEAH box helicase [Flavobacteriaceae bacterium]|jgi:ATP-dependent RNA helicase RhlE|nr:DEAD/DEAH box helicase [Flavobacteriaceae bacterium]